jgi:hypothetical protein
LTAISNDLLRPAPIVISIESNYAERQRYIDAPSDNMRGGASIVQVAASRARALAASASSPDSPRVQWPASLLRHSLRTLMSRLHHRERSSTRCEEESVSASVRARSGGTHRALLASALNVQYSMWMRTAGEDMVARIGQSARRGRLVATSARETTPRAHPTASMLINIQITQ